MGGSLGQAFVSALVGLVEEPSSALAYGKRPEREKKKGTK